MTIYSTKYSWPQLSYTTVSWLSRQKIYIHTLKIFSHSRLKNFYRCILCCISGYILNYAFPPHSLWFLAAISPALWCMSIGFFIYSRYPLSVISAITRGFSVGFGLFFPILHFTSIVAGFLPWLGLTCLESLFFSLWAVLVVLIERNIKYLSARKFFPFLYISIIPCTFLTVEWLRSRVPFGGFPWIRLGFAISRGPLLSLVSLFSVSGMTLLCMIWGVLCVLAIKELVRNKNYRLSKIIMGVILIYALIFIFSSLYIKSYSSASSFKHKKVVIAAIQASQVLDDLGTVYFSSENDSENYIYETYLLAAKIRRGEVPQPDIVIWPENASDSDPFRDPSLWQKITNAARAVNVPIVVGTLLKKNNKIMNSVIVWDPHNPPHNSSNNTIRHDKIYVQPFGEYVPWRSFFRFFFPVVDKANNISAGNDSGVIIVNGVKVGTAICYEVAFDQFYQRAILHDAQIFAVPTNNSSFGYSPMTYIQLAMSQVRAVEFHRSVVVASKTGVSAFVTEDGKIHDSTQISHNNAITMTLALNTDRTWAVICGPWLEWMAIAVTVLLLYSCVHGRWKERRREIREKHTGIAYDTILRVQGKRILDDQCLSHYSDV